MLVSTQDALTPAGEAITEGTARALLRYVDRAALDQLLAAFIGAVGLPAAVLGPNGGFVAGQVTRCPACAPDANGDVGQGPFQGSGISGWVRCQHGQASVVFPVSARTGERLASIAVGPVALSETDVDLLRRGLTARGGSDRAIRACLRAVTRSSADRVEAAARLLAQTLDTVVREAAIASENADLVATQLRANRELTVLYSVARALGSGIELQAVLQRLVDVVGEMLGSEVALVGLIEEDELVTTASRGLLTFEARNGRLKVGEGLAGRVAATGAPLTCRDMQEDPREYLTAINSREQLHAFAGVPLMLNGSTVGVLAVYRRVPHTYPESELQLLAHIADQAAVAMERTRLYEQERHTIGELRALHTQIETQHRTLERATTVHDQLTALVLQDAGLDAIVDALARSLEAPVVVQDRFLHLLAYGPREEEEPDGFTAWAPNTALADGEVRRLFDAARESRRPVAIPAAPEVGLDDPRIVAPVVVGGDLLGFLSVIERERTLAEPDLLAMGHATTVIALEMMKQRTRAEVERRLRGELLEELVAGEFHDAEAIQRRAAYLGYDLTKPHALLLLTADEPAASPLTAPRQSRVSPAAVISDLIEERGNGSMVLPRGEGTFVSIPLGEGTPAEAREIAESLRGIAASRVGAHVTGGMGRICQSPEDFAVAASEAKRAIALASALGAADRVVAFEDLGVYRLLGDLPRPSDALRFSDDLLGPLAAYDADHGANLLPTLEAYLAANGVLQRAAAAMSVHVNTLTYRLQKIRDLTGVDFNDSDARLGLHLAVKIRQAVQLTVG
jgi:sugar diacid utilization regulator